MTILDSILGAMGTPDPEQQMEEWSRQQSAKNRAAIDPNNPLPPPDGTSPATTTPPGQVPNNAKSDPDMGALIGQLARREQANQGFNQALGMGFGAFAQPRDREAVDKMFNVEPLDATKLGQSIMNANSNQQGQYRTNALLNFVNSDAGAQLAKANNMTPEQLRALAISNPGAIADLQKTLATPSTTMGDVMGMDQWLASHGASPEERKVYTTMIGTKMMPTDVQNMFMATQKYRQENNGQDPPWINDPDKYKIWVQDQGQKQSDRSEAQKAQPQTTALMSSLKDEIKGLKTDPGMQKLMDPNTNQAKKQFAEDLISHEPGTWTKLILGSGYSFDADELKFLSRLKRIQGQQYSQAIHSMPGSRFSTQEANAVHSGLGELNNLSLLDSNSYNDRADDLVDDINTYTANAHGAAQNFRDLDPELRTYVNPLYTKGGELNVKGSGSEDWADKVKMTDEELSDFRTLQKPVTEGGKGYSLKQAKAWARKNGLRPPEG